MIEPRAHDEEFSSYKLTIIDLPCNNTALSGPRGPILSIPEQRCNNAGLSVHRNENRARYGEFKIFRGGYCSDITVMHPYRHALAGYEVISEDFGIPYRPLVKPSLTFHESRISYLRGDYCIPFINRYKINWLKGNSWRQVE